MGITRITEFKDESLNRPKELILAEELADRIGVMSTRKQRVEIILKFIEEKGLTFGEKTVES